MAWHACLSARSRRPSLRGLFQTASRPVRCLCGSQPTTSTSAAVVELDTICCWMSARDLILRLQQAGKLACSDALLSCHCFSTFAAPAQLVAPAGCLRPFLSCHLWTRRPSPSRSSTSSGMAGLLVWSSLRLSSHTSAQSTPTTSTATTFATTLTTGEQPGLFDGCSYVLVLLCLL